MSNALASTGIMLPPTGNTIMNAPESWYVSPAPAPSTPHDASLYVSGSGVTFDVSSAVARFPSSTSSQ